VGGWGLERDSACGGRVKLRERERDGESLEIMIFFLSYRRRISFCPNWGKIGRKGLSLIHIK
jgi:hypothetical protein